MAKSKKELLQAVLSDQEQIAIQMFVDNDVQREAVKKILLWGVHNTGTIKKGEYVDPTRNFAWGIVQAAQAQGLDNETIGRRMLAAWEGMQTVQSAWQELELFKLQPEKTSKEGNPAR